MPDSPHMFRARVEFNGMPGASESSRVAYRYEVADLLLNHLSEHGFKVMGIDDREGELGCSVELANIGLIVAAIDLVDHPEPDRFVAWIRPALPYVRNRLRRVSTVDLVRNLGSAVSSILRDQGGCKDVRFIDAPPSHPPS